MWQNRHRSGPAILCFRPQLLVRFSQQLIAQAWRNGNQPLDTLAECGSKMVGAARSPLVARTVHFGNAEIPEPDRIMRTHLSKRFGHSRDLLPLLPADKTARPPGRDMV